MKRRWPLLALSLAAGLRWIPDATLPQTSSTLLSGAVACLLLALLLTVLQWKQLSRIEPRNSVRVADDSQRLSFVAASLSGAGLLAAPSVGSVLHGVAAEGYDRTAALCFVALVSALLTGAQSATGLRGRELAASLTSIAGAMLVFPLLLPRSAPDVLGLLLPVLLVGAGTFVLTSRRFGSREAAFALAGGGVGLFSLWMVARAQGQATGWPLGVWQIVLDAAVFGLAAWALRGSDAVAYAARWAWTPAVTVLSALAIERPGWQPRILVGALLLVGAGAALAWPGKPETAVSTRLLS